MRAESPLVGPINFFLSSTTSYYLSSPASSFIIVGWLQLTGVNANVAFFHSHAEEAKFCFSTQFIAVFRKDMKT